MPRKVLHILETALPIGQGLASIVEALGRRLDPQEYELHAWFLEDEGPLADDLRAAGVRVECLRWKGTRFDPLGAMRFARMLRRARFDILHQHAGGRTIPYLAHWLTGTRTIVHLHSRVSEPQGVEPVVPNIDGADLVIATSHAVGDLVGGPRIRVVHPGIDLPPSTMPHVATADCIGTAARLEPVKGISFLLEAFALLLREVPQAQLEIAGDGTERAALLTLATRLGLQGRVVFLGWQRDILPLFSRWRVYAQPSLEEGFGISALQAMAAGLPIVATRVGGTAELVEEGTSGLLVPPRDPRALAAALAQLLRDAALRSRVAAAARQRATLFSTQRMVTAIAEVYRELLAS